MVIIEKALFEVKWPIIRLESMKQMLDKFSFSLDEEEIKDCLIESENQKYLIDSNKAYKMGLEKYSKALAKIFNKDRAFI